jgi:hypothetical protein
VRICVLAALLLSGCASSQIDANETGGMLKYSSHASSDLLSDADAHCRQFGMSADIRQWDSAMRIIYFGCIKN